MVQHRIENDRLRVVVADYGAELMEIQDKQGGRSVLWKGDPAHWARRAPLLFPCVGAHCHGQYQHLGQVYPMPRHGFARDMDFVCTYKSDYEVTHVLTDNASTREYYPFHFKLEVTHRLEEESLVVIWRVENTGDGEMPFTIGGHPAFALDEEAGKEGYILDFPGRQELKYLLIDPTEGHPNPRDVHLMSLQDGCYSLDDDFFAEDARIFDGAQFDEVILRKKDGTPLVALSAPGFPNFGIWSKPEAPFICLEPWIGRTDDVGFSGELTEKPGVLVADPGDVLRAAYTIVVY